MYPCPHTLCNPLIEIPEGGVDVRRMVGQAALCTITGLEELRLNQNRLSGLPPDLARLGKLQDLQVVCVGL